MILALLSDVENKYINSRAVHLWLKRLTALASDADYCFDELTYEVSRQKIELIHKVRDFFTPSNPLVFRLKLGHKIKDIESSLDKLYKESNSIGLRPIDAMSARSIVTELRKTDPSVIESEVVGRNNDVSMVIDMLVSEESEKDLAVISIVGMPGQGKTTLAQLVYKNDEVVRHFDERVWVCVSEEFNVERLLIEMVQSLTLTDFGVFNREAIVKKLQQSLNGKKYLLVLDDVWNEDRDKWDCMRRCLMGIGGLRGSKIIVTTRSDEVVATMQVTSIHRLNVLSDEDSWSLFKQTAFADRGELKAPDMMDIGRRIARRCSGVPLAIKALGGLMYSLNDAQMWSKVENSLIWGSSWNVEGVLSTLRLSYNHLPSLSLRQCFAYCSIFPKDSVMEKDKLVQLWIAQGLINYSKEEHLELEEIGNKYFNILLRNSLFQDAEKDDYGSIKSCQMHDLVHDLALHISKDFCSTMKAEDLNDNTKAIHLSVTCREDVTLNLPKEPYLKLRTLQLVGGVVDTLGGIFTSAKYLRVLILDSFNIKELPKSVGKLKHLRYLDITRTSIKSLPDTITKLYNMQTMRFSVVEKMPNNLRNFINLRHLYMEDVHFNRMNCMFVGIRQLYSLQTLPFFVVRQGQCSIADLGCLSNLRGNLRIYSLENVRTYEEAREANLFQKANINSLELHWDRLNAKRIDSNDENILEGLEPHLNLKDLTIANYSGIKFPSWLVLRRQSDISNNLTKIALLNCNRCEHVPSLGHLPHLRYVKVCGMDNVKCIGSEFYGLTDLGSPYDTAVNSFPALTELTLSDMPMLVEWCEPTSSLGLPFKVFPCLEKLKVDGCPELIALPHMNKLVCLQYLSIVRCKKLTGLPDWFKSLESLEKLEIRRCSRLVSIPDMHCFHSLRRLELLICETLSSLPNGIQECKLLEHLYVRQCPALNPEGLDSLDNLKELRLGNFPSEFNYFPWPSTSSEAMSFVSLNSLTLHGWPELTSLPRQLEHLVALKHLSISEFGVEDLPDWLCSLSFLESLSVTWCGNLMYLPSLEAMRRLVNLKQFEIVVCPLLDERCTEGNRPEWHKIAHISRIRINYQTVQCLS